MRKTGWFLALCALGSLAGQAHAADWLFVSGYAGDAPSPGTLVAGPGARFSDGEPLVDLANWQDVDWSTYAFASTALTPAGQPAATYSLVNDSFYSPNIQSPRVDLATMTANFSAFYFSGWPSTASSAPVVGWQEGVLGDVPLVRNADGSYTASWMTPGDSNFGNPSVLMSVTFVAAPVPEPASSALLLLGLGWLGLRRAARSPAP